MNLAAVLVYLVPGASFSLENDDYATLIWGGPGVAPTLAQCQAAWPLVQAQAAAEVSNESTLNNQAEAALVNLRAYRDLASPTQAQTVAIVKVICRVLIALIRFRLNKLDATD